MIYNQFQGLQLSALGMGAMRLPVIDGNDSQIDEQATKTMVDYAMSHGVNYYDTAWGYHDGNSELAMGKCLSAYPRDSFYLADKFPGYDASTWDKVEQIFEQQLKKCGVDYFDFYLFHNVCDVNIDAYLDPKYRIYDYLIEQKRNGRIKHLGCSMHGDLGVMKRFFDAYGKDMEFCQLQVNYLDWKFQSAKEKVDFVKTYNIPVWVMEPLRGGRLARLDAANEAVLRSLRPAETTPQWAFRFLQSVPEVCVTLSGMSDFDQLKANIATFDEFKPLNEAEMSAILTIADEMTSKNLVPCTACHYCVSHCPQGLDIPSIISLYNEDKFTGGGFLAPMSLAALPDAKRPTACLGCRSCEAVCPQNIKISEIMSAFGASTASLVEMFSPKH